MRGVYYVFDIFRASLLPQGVPAQGCASTGVGPTHRSACLHASSIEPSLACGPCLRRFDRGMLQPGPQPHPLAALSFFCANRVRPLLACCEKLPSFVRSTCYLFMLRWAHGHLIDQHIGSSHMALPDLLSVNGGPYPMPCKSESLGCRRRGCFGAYGANAAARGPSSSVAPPGTRVPPKAFLPSGRFPSLRNLAIKNARIPRCPRGIRRVASPLPASTCRCSYSCGHRKACLRVLRQLCA